METISIANETCTLCGACVAACPFGAMELGQTVSVNAACKLCKLCAKSCPTGAIRFAHHAWPEIDKRAWSGVLVYAEQTDGAIHPVSLELIGEAIRLTNRIGHDVCAVIAGAGVEKAAAELTRYGVARVYHYDHAELRHFRSDLHANAVADCVRKTKPAIVLVGATSVGRSLAPRLSARFRTGLTADCTSLEVRDEADLVQIRPAFGGNIMARIVTPFTRPQFATVRYKVMNPAEKSAIKIGIVQRMALPPEELVSGITVRRIERKQTSPGITEADVLVVAGRGLKTAKDLTLVQSLAAELGGQVAVTRPLVEAGWIDHTRQIGLSGRTVKPKLLVACGVSGAIQFTASMAGAERVIAINTDRNAPIFKVAHHGIVGDIYKIVPALLDSIRQGRSL